MTELRVATTIRFTNFWDRLYAFIGNKIVVVAAVKVDKPGVKIVETSSRVYIWKPFKAKENDRISETAPR